MNIKLQSNPDRTGRFTGALTTATGVVVTTEHVITTRLRPPLCPESVGPRHGAIAVESSLCIAS